MNGAYRMVAEVGVAEVAQAMAASGIGVAILTDDPAYELRKLYIDGPGRPAAHHAARRLGPDALRRRADPRLRRGARDAHGRSRPARAFSRSGPLTGSGSNNGHTNSR